jgi:hypothetical protein
MDGDHGMKIAFGRRMVLAAATGVVLFQQGACIPQSLVDSLSQGVANAVEGLVEAGLLTLFL